MFEIATPSTTASGSIISEDLKIDQATSSESTASSSASLSLSAANPERKFTSFPKLPIELRLKIWKLSKEPRVVEVLFHVDGRKNTHKLSAKPPALLGVCRESRTEGLTWYKVAFLNVWAVNSVYFDFANDILYLNRSFWKVPNRRLDYFLNRQMNGDLGKVKRLALSCLDPPDASILSKFTAMNELMVATEHFSACTHPTRACPQKSFGLHDMAELMELNADRAEVLEELKHSKYSFIRYKKLMQDKFPDIDVLLTHQALCEPAGHYRYFQ